MKLPRNLLFCLPLLWVAAACSTASGGIPASSPMPVAANPDSMATAAAASTRTPRLSQIDPSPTIENQAITTPTLPTAVLPEVCSPLQDIPIIELPEMISNPFSPPPPGSDDPHQGADFAELYGAERIAITGRQVNAVLPGTVVAVISERFPYGNAVLIETAIEDLPQLLAASLPTPAPTPERKAALTCPEVTQSQAQDTAKRTLYLLYAHMLEPPALQLGDSLTCGQKIGKIGSTGNALNPHLHLEARVGPAGMSFPSMAHYETRATPEEMSAYCLWRISGAFQLVDPLTILKESP